MKSSSESSLKTTPLPKRKYNDFSDQEKAGESTLLAYWIKTSEDRFIKEHQVHRFFQHYANIDLEQTQKEFKFWCQAFQEITKPSSSKAMEIKKLKKFAKDRVLSKFSENPQYYNLIKCAMIMTVNCFRNRVYEQKHTAEYGSIGSSSFALAQAFGTADEIIEKFTRPFLEECAKELGGRSLETRLDLIAKYKTTAAESIL